MPLNDMQCAWQIWAPFADLNVGTYTRDIFDAYMPMVRYEAQPGLGLAIRKYTLAQRGVIAHETVRKPGAALSDRTKTEVDALANRQKDRIARLAL
jgi:4-hydroxy-tetrahydrodipicolinate synthase